MLTAEGTGKNIEKAIENALLELKAPREDVDIKIISEGGLFKKAKVVVSISEDSREKYEKRDERRKALLEEETVAEKENERQENILKDVEKEIKETQKEEKKAEKAIEKIEKKAEKEEQKVRKEKVEKNVDPMKFLKGLFESVNINVEIRTEEDENYITYIVESEEDLGGFIGRHGDAYYAISKLLSTVAGKTEKKLLLDIGGYREQRKASLTSLAYRTANKVASSGRYIKLEPMNPADRRIIHTALQNDNRVSTHSKGTDPHRYVIIFPQGE